MRHRGDTRGRRGRSDPLPTRPPFAGGDRLISCHDSRVCPVFGGEHHVDRREIRHVAHDRPRPRRLRRVRELGPRDRSAGANGHHVVAAANPLRGLAADATAVSDLVRTIEGPVLLVAHSYGGAVISNVDRDAGDIVGLVYVNGFAPDAGENCFGLAAKFPGSRLGEETVAAGAAQRRDDGLLRRAGQLQRRVLRRTSRAAQAALLAATQRPATQEALVEPSGEHPLWKDVPCWFLIGEEDRIIPPQLQRYMAERAGSQRTVEIEGASHAMPVSRPDATARLILEATAPVRAAA